MVNKTGLKMVRAIPSDNEMTYGCYRYTLEISQNPSLPDRESFVLVELGFMYVPRARV